MTRPHESPVPEDGARDSSPTMSNVLLAAALEYAARGWLVLPLHSLEAGACTCRNPKCNKQGKHPRINTGQGHSAATKDPDQIRSWWIRWPSANVGIRTGAASGLVVLDIDTRHGGEASLATLLEGSELPATPAVRTGGGGQHLYFAHPGHKIRNAVGFRPGLDLRADGGLIVAPPSLHASGDRYTWMDRSEPEGVPLAPPPVWLLAALEKPKCEPRQEATRAPAEPAVRTTARANPWAEAALRDECKAVAHAPVGTRNGTLNRAAFSVGQLVPHLLGRERVEVELHAAATTCGLVVNDGEERVRATIKSGLEAGMQTPRGPRESEDSSDRAGTLQVGSAAPAGRPTIVIRSELAPMVDEAHAALLQDADSGVYVRGRTLVRVSDDVTNPHKWLTRERGAPLIEPITAPDLLYRLDRAVSWKRADGRPGRPPKAVVDVLLARGDWAYRWLTAVVETPTLCPDGSVIEKPGYDDATGILYRPRQSFPSLPTTPTRDDAVRAAAELLDPLRDFPFDGEEFISAALAAILTLLGRHAIHGCVPLFAIRSPTGGTGKGLLVDVIAIIGTGWAPARMVAGRHEEENRKRLLAIGLGGEAIVLLDNVDRCLASEVIAAALTSGFIGDRLLGVSKNVAVPLRAVWMATGNGLTFGATLGRRVVLVDIDARREFPEERSGFRYPDLLDHVRHCRAELVIAGLTILTAYINAGRPVHGKTRMGSFETWDDLIRGACIWLGFRDPLTSRDRIRAEGDQDVEMIRTLFTSWHDAFGSEGMAVAAVKAAAEKRATSAGQEDKLMLPELHAALAALDPRGEGAKLNARAIGERLRAWKHKIANGLTLAMGEKKHHGAAVWTITRSGESGELG